MCPVPRWQLGEESKADLDVGEGLVGLVEAAGDVGEEQHGQLLVCPLRPPETSTRSHTVMTCHQPSRTGTKSAFSGSDRPFRYVITVAARMTTLWVSTADGYQLLSSLYAAGGSVRGRVWNSHLSASGEKKKSSSLAGVPPSLLSSPCSLSTMTDESLTTSPPTRAMGTLR